MLRLRIDIRPGWFTYIDLKFTGKHKYHAFERLELYASSLQELIASERAAMLRTLSQKKQAVYELDIRIRQIRAGKDEAIKLAQIFLQNITKRLEQDYRNASVEMYGTR